MGLERRLARRQKRGAVLPAPGMVDQARLRFRPRAQDSAGSARERPVARGRRTVRVRAELRCATDRNDLGYVRASLSVRALCAHNIVLDRSRCRHRGHHGNGSRPQPGLG